MNSISLVSVAHNSSHVLDMFLQRVEFGLEPDDEIILVDSGSTDIAETREIAARHQVILIENENNIGYGAGSNIGAAIAKNDWLAIVNPDVDTSFDDLRQLARIAESNTVQCLGPQLMDLDGNVQTSNRGRIAPPWRQGSDPPRTTGEVIYSDSISGCCMMIPAVTFRQCGGFDEFFFMFCEEIDLQARIRASGGAVATTPTVVARTAGGASSSTASRRWSVTERSVAHVRYVSKHFSRIEATADAIWRILEILNGGEFRPRGNSLRQFVSGVFRRRAS